jgi:hypothetical protein
MTDWKWRLFLFVRAADNTPDNRQAFGHIFADNTSGETVENESKLFDAVTRLSVSGEVPAQVFGINTAVKADMRTALQVFVDTLSQSRYYGVANVDLPQHAAGDLLVANGGSGVVGEVFTWQDALDDLYDERGLQVIGNGT